MKQKKLFPSPPRKKLSYFSSLNSQPHPPTLLQATWQNNQGNECKQIIGPNRCFCTHSFQCHENPKIINSTFCMVPGCKCKCYSYVPYFDIKCMCRHSYKEHDRNTKKCRMCEKCLGFVTNWCCRCGIKYQLHQTVFKQKKSKNSVLINSQRKGCQIQKSKTLQLQPQNNEIITQSLQKLQKSRASAYSRHNFQAEQKLSKKYRCEHQQSYESHFQELSENDLFLQEQKKKCILRINEKFSTLSFQKQMENCNQSTILGLSGVRRPELARRVTALQLLIRPHNYCYIPLQKFLQKEYRKNGNKQNQE